ncbi:MAG TPA: LLM class flavin-dependent oxidoreductase [Dehalococcoidia bacterium]|nr:LLM class flavin-dependent oxidoreductase [Dehalococcoidia bacterium]
MPDASNTVDFGIFDWIDYNSGLNLPELYEQRLRMLEYADEAGFWCYHLAEHHGTPLGMAPAPNLFLAAAAQRTTRLRLGPLVQLLPLSNPLRNIEEVCVLDGLSNGRLELGVGRGISAPELALYGLTSAEARARFDECLEILVMGLATGFVNYEGQFYKYDNVKMPVRPVQQPYPPLWYPTSNVSTVPWIAEHGFSSLFGFSLTTLEEAAAAFREHRALSASKAGRGHRLNGHVTQPRFGVSRHIYVAETDEKALEVARTAYTAFDANFTERPAVRLAASRRGDFDTALAAGSIYAGTPATVRDKIQAFVDATGANYFAAVFAYGNLTTDQILGSMRLFAEEVMPNLRPAYTSAVT